VKASRAIVAKVDRKKPKHKKGLDEEMNSP